MSERAERDKTSIVVIGAGPTGAILALELARQSVPSIVIERTSNAPLFPKMDYINGRSMELMRRLGVLSEIRAGGVEPHHPSNFLWIDSLADPPVAVWRHPSPDQKARQAGHHNDGSAPLEPYGRIAGALLEKTLREKLREHPLVDLREGWNFEGFEQDEHCVDVTVRRANTVEQETLRADYLVGCDGARSRVRSAAGIEAPLAAPPSSRCSIYFRSDDAGLRRWGRSFITTSSRGITLVSRDEKELWTASFPIPDDGSIDLDDPVAILTEKLGAPVAVTEVLSVNRWQGALSVSSAYRNGRVFLAGDSGHQFYPFGGHGANTGIGDAVDLGWKLAAVAAGWGGPRLLDSYEAERRPVALFNREMSANLLEVWRRYSQLSADGATRAHRAGFLAKEEYQANNIGIHFGYRYEDSPVIVAEDGPQPRWDWEEITVTSRPGVRAPSVHLRDGSALFDHFGTGLTLVDMSHVDAGKPLVARADERGIPMTHLPVDEAVVRQAWQRDLVIVRPDQHVAWRGDTTDGPIDVDMVLDVITGRQPAEPGGRP